MSLLVLSDKYSWNEFESQRIPSFDRCYLHSHWKIPRNPRNSIIIQARIFRQHFSFQPSIAINATRKLFISDKVSNSQNRLSKQKTFLAQWEVAQTTQSTIEYNRRDVVVGICWITCTLFSMKKLAFHCNKRNAKKRNHLQRLSRQYFDD